MSLTPEQILANKEKLRAKYGESRTGGKGTERIKQKAVSKAAGNDDKALKGMYKRLGVQQIPQVDDVNMFKDDGSILHFSAPEVHLNMQGQVVVVSGEPETKTAKDLLPDIISQLGPKQMHLLQELIKQDKKEDAPELVNANFEEAVKVD